MDTLKLKNKTSIEAEKCGRLTIPLKDVISFDTYETVKCQIMVKVPMKSQYHCENVDIDFSCGFKNIFLQIMLIQFFSLK